MADLNIVCSFKPIDMEFLLLDMSGKMIREQISHTSLVLHYSMEFKENSFTFQQDFTLCLKFVKLIASSTE